MQLHFPALWCDKLTMKCLAICFVLLESSNSENLMAWVKYIEDLTIMHFKLLS